MRIFLTDLVYCNQTDVIVIEFRMVLLNLVFFVSQTDHIGTKACLPSFHISMYVRAFLINTIITHPSL